MTYDFDYYLNGSREMMAAVAGLLLSVLGWTLLIGLILWVLRCVSVHTIARRRGLSKPWLAWLPIGHEWMLGSISDQYKYVTAGKIRGRRKVMLALSLSVALCVGVCAGVAVFVGLGGGIELTTMIGLALMWLVLVALGIASVVMGLMCEYDLYRSCDPKNAVAYLVLAIILCGTGPAFMLACRNRDDGMPPMWNQPPAPEPDPEPAGEPESSEEAEPAEEPEETEEA